MYALVAEPKGEASNRGARVAVSLYVYIEEKEEKNEREKRKEKKDERKKCPWKDLNL